MPFRHYNVTPHKGTYVQCTRLSTRLFSLTDSYIIKYQNGVMHDYVKIQFHNNNFKVNFIYIFLM